MQRRLCTVHVCGAFLPQEAYRGCDSRMAQESLRRHVLRLLRVWRSWFIFSDDFLNGLQARTLHPPCRQLEPARLGSPVEGMQCYGCLMVRQSRPRVCCP